MAKIRSLLNSKSQLVAKADFLWDNQPISFKQKVENSFEKLNYFITMEETKTQESTPGETSKGKVNPLAILSYIGVLCLVPLLVEKKDEFVKFHARQGLVLFICEIATMLIAWIPIIGWFIGFAALVIWIVLSIMGIINVVSGKKTALPVIGQFADRFKI